MSGCLTDAAQVFAGRDGLHGTADDRQVDGVVKDILALDQGVGERRGVIAGIGFGSGNAFDNRIVTGTGVEVAVA
ncbi:hypothetical protein [Roseibium sediminicola]|uniref:Uncharacterized protein n=1 Tax=Roseibium sediminicola TaxID=2933272 RepID=A0ABT0H2C8_9HYPH|nr:hypothetical protein [Roseibium sp. CAU 1639]MCK7615843.1 hypothetical protein [Roseibium sp. CAU 1639]